MVAGHDLSQGRIADGVFKMSERVNSAELLDRLSSRSLPLVSNYRGVYSFGSGGDYLLSCIEICIIYSISESNCRGLHCRWDQFQMPRHSQTLCCPQRYQILFTTTLQDDHCTVHWQNYCQYFTHELWDFFCFVFALAPMLPPPFKKILIDLTAL